MPRIHPDTLAHIRGGVLRPCAMVKLWWPNPDRWICFHEQRGTLRYDGLDWHGVGSIARISGVSGGVGLSVQDLTMELPAPESQWAAMAQDARHLKHRAARIHVAFLNPTFDAMQCPPICVFSGRMSALAFKGKKVAEGEAHKLVQLTAQSYFAILSRARQRSDSDPYAAYLAEQILQWPEK